MENVNNAAVQNSFFNFISPSIVENIRRMVPSIGSFFTAAGNRVSEASSSEMARRSAVSAATAAVSSVCSRLAAFGGSAMRFLQNSGLRECVQTLTTLISPQTAAIIGVACIALLIFSKKARKCALSTVKFLVLFAIKLPFKLAAHVLLLGISCVKKIANIAFLTSLLGFVASVAIGSQLGSNAQLLDQITRNFAVHTLTSGLILVGLSFISAPLNFIKNM